jgi:hypothetical protein
MKRCATMTAVAAIAAAWCLCPWSCPEAEAGLVDENGNTINPTPAVWVFSLKQAKAKAFEKKKPIYLYFASEKYAKAKNMPVQFMYNAEMQKLSKQRAIFCLLIIPDKERSDEQKELVKTYKVSRTPYGVVADYYGNPLAKASTTSTSRLSRQITSARKTITKILKMLKVHLEKGKGDMEKGRWATAKYHFKWITRTFPTYPEAEEAAALMKEIEEKEAKEKAAKEKEAEEKKKPERKEELEDPAR